MTAPNASLAYGIRPPGYRLPDATHVGRVRLQISDLERSIAYYQTVIGLRVLERGAGVALLGPHDADTVIVELHEKPGVRHVPRRGLLGLYHFAILLPTRSDLARFVAHLASIGEYAGMSDHFVSEAVYLTDPDGLGIEVYADRPRSAWQVDDRQLVMSTEPLNVRDLLAEAGDSKWSGAPARTAIGHVHLFVGNIEHASKFYHEALGLDKVVWSYPGALFLSAGGYHHHLGTNTWAAGAPPASDNDARLLEWELKLPDVESVDAAAESLSNAGFSVDRDGSAALVADPWGTCLRLLAGV